MTEVIQLFPTPQHTCPLKGLYLNECLHQQTQRDRPFIYANFVSSLDGRIALKSNNGSTSFMPKGLSNPNDFRLFLELHAQADCLITHGGYLRALAQGRLGNVLQLDAHANGIDLAEWRIAQGLKPQPDVVIASSSLDFPLPKFLQTHGQTTLIATGKKADPERLRFWESQACDIMLAGKDRQVEGAPLTQALAARGYRSIYLVAGPQILDTMLRQKQLDRLYLTQRHQLIGGEDFHSLIPGNELGSAGNLKLRSLYLDSSSASDGSQLFSSFDL